MSTAWLPYCTCLFLSLTVTTIWINTRQPLPYMDELFHVPQAQRFCSSFILLKLPHYDSSISTPPGLYLPVALLAFATRSLSLCTTLALRISSAIATVLSCVVLSSVLCLLRFRGNSTANESGVNIDAMQPQRVDYATALVMVLTPMSFFYSGFYYTDPPAMLYVLLTWYFSLRERHGLSALLGIMSTLTRQTNMFWHFFIAIDSLLFSWLIKKGRQPTLKGTVSVTARPNLPHIFAGILYLSFLYINNGAAIGDKQHHTAMIHYAMLPYFSFFHAIAHSVFQLASPATLMQTMQAMVTLSNACPILIATAATIIGLIASTADYAHPFTLADNRHLTFYLYRRWLLRSTFHRFSLTPLYMWTPITVLVERITVRVPPKHQVYHRLVDLLLLLVICTVTLHPLLELRYFTIPSLILSIRRVVNMKNPPSLRLLHVAIAVLTISNMLLVYIFAERPFSRPPDKHMPNDLSPGRFMF